MNMDDLKRRLSPIKANITKITNWFLANKHDADIYLFQLKLELLIKSYTNYENLSEEIYDKDDQVLNEQCDELEQKYCNTLSSLRRRIDELKEVELTVRSDQPTTSTKLPEISIASFTGVFSEWKAFIELFKTLIINNTTLSDIQKFIYLKSYLKGEPLELINSLALTSDNFEIALDTLRERYENQSRIINAHMKRILEVPVLAKTSASEVRKFIVQVKQGIQSLENLDVPKEEWADLMLIYIYTQKLDFNTNKAFESERDPKKRPSLQEFLEFLDNRSSVMETVSENFPAPIYRKPNPKGSYHAGSQNTPQNNQSFSKKCPCCASYNHRISQCDKFKTLSIQQRFDFVRQKKLCRNCLSPQHVTESCASIKLCLLCNKKHHTLLHNPNIQSGLRRTPHQSVQTHNTDSRNGNEFTTSTRLPPIEADQTNQDVRPDPVTSNVSCSSIVKSYTETLLATAVVTLYSQSGEKISARALLDNGSQTSFVTEHLVEKLQCGWYRKNFQITGIGQQLTKAHKMLNLKFHPTFDSRKQFSVSCIVLNNITSNLPRVRLEVSALKIPKGIQLADPEFFESQPVDLLLGIDVYSELLCGGFKKLGNKLPVLINTHLGWTISGNIPIQNTACNLATQFDEDDCYSSPVSFLLQIPTVEEQADKLIQQFWTVEDIAGKPPLTEEDELAESLFQKTTVRLPNGKFQVNLPLRSPEEHSKLGQSFPRALKRFFNLEQKLHKNPDLFQEYKKFIDDYVDQGHAAEVPLDTTDDKARLKYYLPHHCVIRQDSVTTKLRVVFDASMKTDSNYSLNDIMLKGPTNQPELFDILCRFRTYQFVLSADIEKMFRQILINPEQRFLQNILWRDNPMKPLKCIELRTVTYGTNSAPYLSTRCLLELANREEKAYPLASRALRSQCYVDDILYGCNSEKELFETHRQLTELLKSAGMPLHKWCSNSKVFLNSIASNERGSKYVFRAENNTNKVLGIIWEPNTDHLLITFPKELNEAQTKRQILSLIAQVFDPLGLIGPYVMIAKIFMQKIWLSKTAWDEPLNDDLLKEWETFFKAMPELAKVKIPRNLFLQPRESVRQIQIHAFSDASLKGYGTCIYLWVQYNDDNISCNLIAAKSRVAPLKQLTLPRLELQGAVLMASLSNRIRSILDASLTIDSVHLWTDSEIVLSWIKSHPSRWSVYVANRVSIIQTQTAQCHWHHVSSGSNPADVISKGAMPCDLIKSELWWYGPSYLRNPQLDLTKYDTDSIGNPPEERKSTLFIQKDEQYFCDNVFLRYSSFQKLLRFISNLKRKKSLLENNIGALTLYDLQDAEKIIVKVIQEKYFAPELQDLKNSRTMRNKSLKTLKPFIDDSGVIRVGGRLLNADIEYEHKHPVLLPSKNFVVRLIIKKEHLRLYHAGAQNVLANIRLRYWPIDGIREVKGVIRQCITCFKTHPRPATQLMGDLPKERLTVARPFLNVGIDFGGPFRLKPSSHRSNVILKGYLAVFVCMTTRAVPLELVSSLTAEDFLQALRRFISRRGIPEVIFSDNATNFQGTNNKLKELYKFFTDNKTKASIDRHLSNNEIKWKFIPARSPHWGGIWEAAVKSSKHHIVRVIGETLMTFEQFTTILTEIEAILNSRPLCPLSSDPTDLTCLTPGHFLIGAPMMALPVRDHSEIPENRLNRWMRCVQIRQHFWKRWSVEYISHLQKRTKWLNPNENLKEGDLVLLVDEGSPPLRWPLARIVHVLPGRDERVRAVRVRTQDGEFIRAITKVCPLPDIDNPQ